MDPGKNKKSLRTSIFKRLSFPASNSNKSSVPVSMVFDHINSSTIKTAPNSAINLQLAIKDIPLVVLSLQTELIRN
jgi:hypothetical protein